MHDVSPFFPFHSLFHSLTLSFSDRVLRRARARVSPRLVRIHHVVRFVAVRKVNRWFHSTLFICGRAMIYTGLVPELSRSFTERRDVDVFLASRDENSLASYENVKERGKLLEKNLTLCETLFLTRPEERYRARRLSDLELVNRTRFTSVPASIL